MSLLLLFRNNAGVIPTTPFVRPTQPFMGFHPGIFPGESVSQYFQDQLTQISGAINALATGHIDPTYAPPAKTFEGDVRLADGANWNPGSGMGFYAYYNAGWHFLG